MIRYIRTLAIPLIVVLVGFLVVTVLFGEQLQGIPHAVMSTAITIVALFWSGWAVYSEYRQTLLLAAYTGGFVFFIDFLALKVTHTLTYPPVNVIESPQDWNLLLLGLLIAFIIYTPAAMLVAAIGGWSAKKYRAKAALP
jgi:hypothetical protein